MHLLHFRITVISVVLWGCIPAFAEPLRLNHIQVIGTHNSYHVRPPDYIFETLSDWNAEVMAWDYTHDPLDIQLDNGVRNFELDIHPFTDGFAVMHVPVVDEASTCPIFVDCLRVVYDWSQRNPRHLPVSFLLEFKMREALMAGKPLMEINEAMCEAFEQAILSVFPREQLFTPDDIRGDAPTLTEAVRAHGWPTLEESLGKVFFVLHNRSELRQVYTEGRNSLEGRLMFVNSSPDRDDAAYIVVDNPYSDSIPELLRYNMLVRVRADSGLREARRGDGQRRDAAFSSGAHVVSTDFPNGKAHPDTGYVVAFPDNAPARCNPLFSPDDCTERLNALLENKNE